MTLVVLVLSGLGLLIATLTAAATLEVYYRVKSLSSIAGIDEGQRGVDLPIVGDRPSDHGLPPDLDERSGIILFVSPRCETCHQVAASLDGKVPQHLYLVVSGSDAEECERWLETYGLDLTSASIDPDYQLANAIGITMTPLAIVLVDGYLTAGVTVPNPQSLAGMLRGLEMEDA